MKVQAAPGWTCKDLESRIAGCGKRYPAGSPDEAEISIYRDFMNQAIGVRRSARVLVLGMTPELRTIALESADELVTVDASAAAISLYKDWVAKPGAETIVETRWQDIVPAETGQFDAVMGDGIFPNLLSRSSQAELFARVVSLLRPGAVAVFRHAHIPDDIGDARWSWRQLSALFRNGRIDANEFGLSARLWGFWNEGGVVTDDLLDNAVVFEKIEKLRHSGEMTESEITAMNRFRYGGRNFFETRREWEARLAETSLAYECRHLTGRLWYEFYPVYGLTKRDG